MLACLVAFVMNFALNKTNKNQQQTIGDQQAVIDRLERQIMEKNREALIKRTHWMLGQQEFSERVATELKIEPPNPPDKRAELYAPK